MISFQDTFSRHRKRTNIYNAAEYWLKRPFPHKLTYIIPIAMCSFTTWEGWEEAVAKFCYDKERYPVPDQDMIDWMGNSAFVKQGNKMDLNITLADPFKSAMAYIPFMVDTYGYEELCKQLWACVK